MPPSARVKKSVRDNRMSTTRCCIAALAVMATSAYAQEGRATLLGTVSDSHGAVIVGARVVVVNTATEVRTTTESNHKGSYLVPYLAPGKYRVRVEHRGFKTVERSPIELRVNDRVRLDVTLDLTELSRRYPCDGCARTPHTSAVGYSWSRSMYRRKLC